MVRRLCRLTTVCLERELTKSPIRARVGDTAQIATALPSGDMMGVTAGTTQPTTRRVWNSRAIGVNVYEVAGPGQGLVDIYMDGSFLTTVDGYGATNQGNVLLWSTGSLANGTHTVKLVNEARPGAGHSGTALILDHIDVVAPSDLSVDDSVSGSGTNQFNYSGSGWGHCTSCDSPSIGRYDASNSWDSTAGDSATFAFNGTGINLYAVMGPSQGYASVWIDNAAATMINTYSPTSIGNQLVWGTQRLSSGSHTLHIKVLGTHAAFSAGNIVILDRAAVVPAGGN